MPLFGPNVKKMKEGSDIDGLAALLKADNLQTRVEAIEALLELGDPKGLQLLTKRYSDIFKFGDEADKVELIIMMQGRLSRDTEVDILLAWITPLNLQQNRAVSILNWEDVKFRRKHNLDLARPILFEAATNSAENPLIRLFALVTLAELGDKSNEVMQLLVYFLIQGQNAWTIKETLRALSYFSTKPEVTDLLIKIQKGEGFVFRDKFELSKVVREAAIYALGATTVPSAREYLEYLVTGGDEFYRRRAQIALKLFGKATYDEIKRMA